MEENTSNRELVCVLFPGVVKNEDKALQCLGGVRQISQIYTQPAKKRLGLSFQPENPYVKKIYANYRKAAGVVLKVKIKKTKVDNEVKREVVSTSVVGRVKKMFKFEAMCDFQYMPVHREGNGPLKCVLEQLLPTGLDDVSFVTGPAPLFIVPSNFTRSDKPTNYSYTDKRYVNKEKKDADEHYRVRAERGTPVIRYDFNLIDVLPTEPHEYYLNRKADKIQLFPELEKEYQIVKKLFDERPILSQNLIRYQTKLRLSSLKIILPCVSLFMKSGPWRMLWVRYGYDPRKEPGARIYQTLDFRLRHQAGVHAMVMTRDQITHYKKADRVRYHRKLQPQDGRDDAVDASDVNEGAVYFRPGMAPTQRQIIYMYCDVKLPEVEAIISQEPPAGYLCHPKRGWLPPNADQQCRDHIFRYVKETLLANHNTEFKLEQGSSGDEGSNSEDDGDSSTDDPSEPSTSNT